LWETGESRPPRLGKPGAALQRGAKSRMVLACFERFPASSWQGCRSDLVPSQFRGSAARCLTFSRASGQIDHVPYWDVFAAALPRESRWECTRRGRERMS